MRVRLPRYIWERFEHLSRTQKERFIHDLIATKIIIATSLANGTHLAQRFWRKTRSDVEVDVELRKKSDKAMGRFAPGCDDDFTLLALSEWAKTGRLDALLHESPWNGDSP